jgi:hypothetical protein
MNYEEKYKDALKRAEAVIKIAQNQKEVYDCITTIFPELKESEDEKIRKGLIGYFMYLKSIDKNVLSDITNDNILTWLEKQGEQKVWTDNDYGRVKSIEYLLHELDNHNFDDWFNSLISPYKEKEAESVDKAKPKFKVGDWI